MGEVLNGCDSIQARETAMNSPTIEELRDAIRRVRRRRNLILHARQIGWSLAILTALFMLCATLEMALHLPSFVRKLFLCLLAAALVVLGWRYARAMRRFVSDDRRLAQYVEERTPDLEQRLITSMDTLEKQREESPSQLVESLWLDTITHVRGRNIQRVTHSRLAWYAAGTAGTPV